MNLKATFKQVKGDYKAGGLDLNYPEDPRDFSLGGFWSRKVGKAPDIDFRVPNIPETIDQFDTDFCTCYQGNYTYWQDTDIKGSPAFLFAEAKRRYYNGDYSGFGLRISHPLGILQNVGICDYEVYPTMKRKRNWMANWRNIPKNAYEQAETRKMKKGYFKVDLYRDMYENFAAAMYNWKEPVLTGMKWYSGYWVDALGKLHLDKTGAVFGHAVSAIEQKIVDGVKWMKFKNSYLNIPEFWLTEDEVRREMYPGYIMLPGEKPAIKIINKYAGQAVAADNSKDVYLIVEGKKRLIPTELEAWCRGILLWNDVIRIPSSDLATIPTGDKVTTHDGEMYSIIREIFHLDTKRFEELKKRI